MNRMLALPEDLQRALWKAWVCDVIRRAYQTRTLPRHILHSPPLFQEVAFLADALWTASYALTPPKKWLPLEVQLDMKGMHSSASQASNVLYCFDLNVDALPTHRVCRALFTQLEDEGMPFATRVLRAIYREEEYDAF